MTRQIACTHAQSLLWDHATILDFVSDSFFPDFFGNSVIKSEKTPLFELVSTLVWTPSQRRRPHPDEGSRLCKGYRKKARHSPELLRIQLSAKLGKMGKNIYF